MTDANEILEKPELPLISIYKNSGIDILNKKTIKYYNKTSAYNLINNNKEDLKMYSSRMKVWHLEQKSDKFKNTKWNRLMAKTIYNPSFDVILFWKQIATYKLTELKAKVKDCIDKDDDCLTQFIEADFLIGKIENASDFNEIINTLNKYCFEIKDEERIWKENEEWNNKR